MDEERWEGLVRRLEPKARADPAAYRRRVLLLAALGYVFIGLLSSCSSAWRFSSSSRHCAGPLWR